MGRVEFDLPFQRKHKEFKENPPGLLTGVPAGIKVEVRPEKEKVKFILTRVGSVEEGVQKVSAGILARVGERGQIAMADSLDLNVVTPLAISVRAKDKLIAGETVKVTVVVERKGPVEDDIELRWKQLPSGVTGSNRIVVLPGQDEIETELKADDSVSRAIFDKLQIEAIYKYAGKQLKADSDWGRIELDGKSE